LFGEQLMGHLEFEKETDLQRNIKNAKETNLPKFLPPHPPKIDGPKGGRPPSV
jgi:hypothetical protein